MDSGVVSTEYTKALDAEVDSVKSDEKVRMRYMVLAEAFARERSIGEYRGCIRQIRHYMNKLSAEEISDLLIIPIDGCISAIETIKAHPDWNDEQVAEEMDWDE